MKNCYLLSLLLLSSALAFGQATVVHTATLIAANPGAGGSVAVTVTSSTSTDLMFGFAISHDGSAFGTVTDNQSQSWTTVSGAGTSACGGASLSCIAFWFKNTAAGVTTVTIPSVAFGGAVTAIVMEYGGSAAGGGLTLDQNSVMSVANTSPWSSASVSTTGTDLVIGVAAGVNVATLTAGSGYTMEQTAVDSGNRDIGVEDQLNASSGSYAATGTSATTATNAQVIAFKFAGASTSAMTGVGPHKIVGPVVLR